LHFAYHFMPIPCIQTNSFRFDSWMVTLKNFLPKFCQ
jgi:hypothetical protein